MKSSFLLLLLSLSRLSSSDLNTEDLTFTSPFSVRTLNTTPWPMWVAGPNQHLGQRDHDIWPIETTQTGYIQKYLVYNHALVQMEFFCLMRDGLLLSVTLCLTHISNSNPTAAQECFPSSSNCEPFFWLSLLLFQHDSAMGKGSVSLWTTSYL